MTDHYQYRITVNGLAVRIHSEYPGSLWTDTAEQATERGYHALLERRLVTDRGLLAFFPDGLPVGYMMLGKMVICPWEKHAEISQEPRGFVVDTTEYH